MLGDARPAYREACRPDLLWLVLLLLAWLARVLALVSRSWCRWHRTCRCPPDGKTLVFAWNHDLWSVAVEGGSAVQLTTDASKDAQPKFSPDGKRLAFVSDRTGSDQIYVMPASGGLPEQKTFHSEGYSLADWYPDGESLLAIGNAITSGVELNDCCESISSNARLRRFCWTMPPVLPRSHRMARGSCLFAKCERWWRKGYRGERSGQIWMLEVDSGETRELLHEGTECLWPMWMPDASGFYFTKGGHNGFDLWSYNIPRKPIKLPDKSVWLGLKTTPSSNPVSPAMVR